MADSISPPSSQKLFIIKLTVVLNIFIIELSLLLYCPHHDQTQTTTSKSLNPEPPVTACRVRGNVEHISTCVDTHYSATPKSRLYRPFTTPVPHPNPGTLSRSFKLALTSIRLIPATCSAGTSFLQCMLLPRRARIWSCSMINLIGRSASVCRP